MTLLAALGIVLIAGLAVLYFRGAGEYEAAVPPQTSRFRYDVEYEAIGYSTRPLTDPIAQLRDRIARGQAQLRYEEPYGYLPSLLAELGVDVASQVLVFSKTSLQAGRILPETPRAIYFGDDVYIGWQPHGQPMEIGAMDRNLGPVFYALEQDREAGATFQRHLETCLRCHDSYSMTGGGVPRFILGSGFINRNGQIIGHEAWNLTDDRTPFPLRWGGWYVTGTHGDLVHLGNLIVDDPANLRNVDLADTGNVTDLSTLIDTDPYLGKHSDIVALMVLDHQVRVQNLLTRVNYDTRTLLHDAEKAGGTLDASGLERIERAVQPLVEALLFVDEPQIEGRIEGASGFAQRFVQRGPFDRRGRTLREFALAGRTFRYPLSYLIYSEAFDALAEPVKDAVYRRLHAILAGADGEEASATFAHLSSADRLAILEILQDTKPDFGAR